MPARVVHVAFLGFGTVDPALPDLGRVTNASAHWHQNTSIRLVPRTSKADYVRFVVGGGPPGRSDLRRRS